MSDDLVHELSGVQYDPREVAARVMGIEPQDGATILEILPPEVAAKVVENLPLNSARHILPRVESSRAAAIVARMNQPAAAAVLSAMAPDDRVDLLGQLDPTLHDALLRQLGAPEQAEARELEQYPPDTAGGIMTTQVNALPRDWTVEQAIVELRRIQAELGQLSYVYVVDELRRLVGVLSMRDLILADPQRPLSEVMIPHVKSVPTTMDQEEVSRQMRSSRFLALPVVDGESRLVGLITLDDVMDVIQEEATEDMQRLFGAGAEERLSSPWQFSFSRRIGWLQVNLATAFLAGAVVAAFGHIIGRFAVLAVYIPIVSGMGSNAAAQAMAVAIRGIDNRKIDRKLLRHVLGRELIVGFLSGIVVGITTAIIAVVWQFQYGMALGVIVGLSLLFTQTLACVSGAAIPVVMQRLGFDPAQSASIFVTTITDIAGFASLLGLATICAAWMR
jgi:magnesium transporter